MTKVVLIGKPIESNCACAEVEPRIASAARHLTTPALIRPAGRSVFRFKPGRMAHRREFGALSPISECLQMPETGLLTNIYIACALVSPSKMRRRQVGPVGDTTESGTARFTARNMPRPNARGAYKASVARIRSSAGAFDSGSRSEYWKRLNRAPRDDASFFRHDRVHTAEISMLHFAERRTLAEYPRGAHRWTLLLLTVLAAVLSGYEFQLAPILPLLLPFLHMGHIQYGYFITFSVLVGAISAFFGGPLADRYGRVVILDACLAIITVLVFANQLIVGIKSFVAIRTLMAIVVGLTAGAGAALVRDMSPRLTRALAFGLLTIGPVGSNYMGNFIAGLTLPIFHTWQSQMWIMEFLSISMYLP